MRELGADLNKMELMSMSIDMSSIINLITAVLPIMVLMKVLDKFL